MFWIALLTPFLLLVVAWVIARKGPVARTAIVLTAIFAALDAYALWDVMGARGASTAGLGIVMLGLIQAGFALAVLIASLIARRSASKSNSPQ